MPPLSLGLGGARPLENYLGVDDIPFCLLNILDLMSSIKIVSLRTAEKAVTLLSRQSRLAIFLMVRVALSFQE